MKICQVVSHVDEEASGPSYSVPRLSESLASDQHDVVLATLQSRSKRRGFDNIQHIEFESTWPPRKLGISKQMKCWFDANASGFDIIHSHGLWMMPNIYPATAAHAHQTTYVVSPRGTLSEAAMRYSYLVKSIFWAVKQKSALNKATAFHATCEEEYGDIRRAGFNQPVAVIPNGIDVASPTIARTGTKSRTLIYLGRFHHKKGLELAIRVWSKLQDDFPDWSFRIVGKGDSDYIQSLRALARDVGAVRVRFEGPLYGDSKMHALQTASLLILPTRNENFGLVVAEALAVGTCVITTREAPWEGLIANKCGWWVERSEGAIEAALREAMLTPISDLDQMGTAGQYWMKRDFSWISIGRRMGRFYSWICNGGETPDFVRMA